MCSLRSVSRRKRSRSQALAEFAMVLPIFLTLMCGVFDYGVMLLHIQVMAAACREGGSAASRPGGFTNALNATYYAAYPKLNLTNTLGGVIVTDMAYYMSNSTTNLFLANYSTNSVESTGKIYGGGDVLLNKSRLLRISTNALAWQDTKRFSDQFFTASSVGDQNEIYGVEVFYTNDFVTPIGTLLKLVAPSILYDVAFFPKTVN